MKRNYPLLVLILLLVQSCCFTNGEEIGRIYFTPEEKAIIPYADNQTIQFITDEDFEFQLNTTVYSTFYSDQDFCEDYTSYENYQVYLNSELPTLDVQLSLQNRYNGEDDDDTLYVAITINNAWFDYDFSEPLETVEINGTTYTDVYHYYSGVLDNPISEVFYSYTFGILKINYLNGDYAQINS